MEVVFRGTALLLVVFILTVFIYRDVNPLKGEMYIHTISVDGMEREYILYVPAQLTKGAALVLALHGGGGGPLGTAELVLKNSGWREKADKEGFLLALPQGTPDYPDQAIDGMSPVDSAERNLRSWNETTGLTKAFFLGVDDVEYIRSVIADIASRHLIDRARIFVTGFSTGATMTYRLGIEMSDTFAAIAPVAGLLPNTLPAPATPVSLLHIGGGEDPIPSNFQTGVPYDAPDPEVNWTAYFSCQRVGQSDTEQLQWRLYTCDGGTSVEVYLIKRLGHAYPGKASLFGFASEIGDIIDATEVIWDFFQKHPRNSDHRP